jgi:hypothetical protein
MRAFLALWNDVAPGREAEYERWHTLEHVPERVAVRGMQGARRYVDKARAPHRYFTLYEADDPGVFECAEYVDLVRNPTAWSASMRPDLLNLVRVPCAVAESHGFGIGGAIAVTCYEHAAAHDPGAAAAAVRDAAGVIAWRCGVRRAGDATPPWHKGAEQPTRPFDRVLLVEALDRDAASAALRIARRALQLDAADDFGAAVYDLAFAFPGHDPASRQRFRRAGWH